MPFNYYIDNVYTDFRVKDGNLLFVRGSDCVAQQIEIALRLQLGEWFLNTDDGIPYYSSTKTLNDNATPGIFGGKFSAAEIGALLRKAILEVPNVVRIETFELTEDLTVRSVSVSSTVLVETFDINGIGSQTIVTINLEV